MLEKYESSVRSHHTTTGRGVGRWEIRQNACNLCYGLLFKMQRGTSRTRLMLELLMLFFVCLAMGKVADADGRSSLIWGGITFVLCIVSLSIPLPYMRFLIVVAVVILLMTLTKSLRQR